MKSKYELSISANYVPDWGIVEGFREIFQNALDNASTNPKNKMGFNFNEDAGEVAISNKTSILEIESLLLGLTTKAGDKGTIGKHGEGYKLGFIALLRAGKTVKVYNYGKKEIWTAKLVKSKRYNGSIIPVVTVEKQAFWKSVPDSDLTVVVGNITTEDYASLIVKNLHLRHSIEAFEVPNMGNILTAENERGNIYVRGLFVCNHEEMTYGYDFEPELIELDRDRKLVRTFDITWNTSAMWRYAYGKDFMRKEVLEMIKDAKKDVQYFKDRMHTVNKVKEDAAVEESIADELAKDFQKEFGYHSYPVMDNKEMSIVQEKSTSKTVMVNPVVAKYIRSAPNVKVMRIPDEIPLKQQFQELLDDIEGKLLEEEVDRFSQLIMKL